MTEHTPVRSTDLSALQGILFEELDNLAQLDVEANDGRLEREVARAKAISDVSARAIENANTAVNIMRARADLAGSKLEKFPRMLNA